MKDKILTGAQQMNISLPSDAAEKMAAYWDAVLETNRTMNLTRITEPDEACAVHFLDSLAPLLPDAQLIEQGARVLDVGTGAGFPGVPLALARPDVQVTLLDARRKKLDFIDHTLKKIDVQNIETIHARAEDHRRRYTVVCARAVAPLPKLCALLLPLTAPGGRAVMWKGPGAESEMNEAASICQSMGAVFRESFYYFLPNQQRDYRLIVVEMSNDKPKY